MTEETQVAPSEATEEDIAEAVEAEAVDEGAEAPAEGGKPKEGEETSETKSRSQERRERRKAHEQRLMSEAEAARREAEETRKRLDRIKAAHEGETAPKESDFTDPFEYSVAAALFKNSQTAAQRERAAIEADASEHDRKAQALEAERKQERVAAFQEQREDARARYADFEAVFQAAIIPAHVADMVLESDQAADIAYHLGKNPALARQVAQMPPLAAARELGRIEAMIALPVPKTQPSAPAPISPVKGTGTASGDPSKMSFTAFKEWRSKHG